MSQGEKNQPRDPEAAWDHTPLRESDLDPRREEEPQERGQGAGAEEFDPTSRGDERGEVM